MAILAAVLIPTVTNKIQDANEASADSTASAIASSIKNDLVAAESGLINSLEVITYSGTASAAFDATKLGVVEKYGAEKGTLAQGIVTKATDNTTYTVWVVSGKRASRYIVTVADKSVVSTKWIVIAGTDATKAAENKECVVSGNTVTVGSKK